MPLVLSSTSPARRALLSRLQIPFAVANPNIDESRLPNESIEDMVKRLSLMKAKASAPHYSDAFIIGSDCVGVLEDTVLNKPLTLENAIAQLTKMSGKMVRFYTGLCLYHSTDESSQLAIEHYDVYFRTLSLPVIKHYLQRESTLYCAGGFQAEGLGITLVQKFSGADYTTLIGLPLIRLTDMLINVGLVE